MRVKDRKQSGINQYPEDLLKTSFPGKRNKMPRLILLRHGQSLWNLENKFTGWRDVDLSDQGRQEANEAAELLLAAGIDFDIAFTSMLQRAIRTLWIVMDRMDRLWVPVHKFWRLNERHYGALQGKDKKQMAAQYGAEQIRLWRRGYSVSPPPLALDDPGHPVHDPHYKNLPRDILPCSESLEDTLKRVLPFWHDRIAPALLCGNSVIIVAHGNSLRALTKHLENISDREISALNIPTGIPRIYELDADLQVQSSRYLGNRDIINAAVTRVEKQV